MAEAANGPVTPLAETILEDNNVVILPDLLLNAVSLQAIHMKDKEMKMLGHFWFVRMYLKTHFTLKNGFLVAHMSLFKI